MARKPIQDNTSSDEGESYGRNVTMDYDDLCEDDYAGMNPEAAEVMKEADKKTKDGFHDEKKSGFK